MCTDLREASKAVYSAVQYKSRAARIRSVSRAGTAYLHHEREAQMVHTEISVISTAERICLEEDATFSPGNRATDKVVKIAAV